jgi:hypothetical protein
LRPTATAHGKAALRRFVATADDRRLERTLGSPLGLRVLFRAFEAAYVAERAVGLTGDIDCELRTTSGRPRPWTVGLTPERAVARPGRSTRPLLTVKLGAADLVRMAAGELDPGSAVLDGRMDLEGDFALAMRLGELFGSA